MMLCSKCKKRPAVVFVSNSADSSDSVGYCLTCAREAGIKPVTDIMDKMGISDDDIEMMQNQMGELMESGMIPENFDELMTGQDDDGIENGEDDDEDFSRGGAPAFPPLFKNLFGGDMTKKSDKKEDKNKKDDKTPKKRKRKHLDTYCTDLTRKARDGKLDRIIGRENELGLCKKAYDLRRTTFAVGHAPTGDSHPCWQAHEYEATFIEAFLRRL